MSRKATLLAVLVLTGAGIVGYRYVTEMMEQRAREASLKAVQAMIAAQKQRQDIPAEQQERMIAQARTWLDDHSDLEGARRLLEQVLKANPRHAPARIEMARYYMKSGHIDYRNFQPGALDKASWELQYARQAAPDSPDVDVLWGHLLYLQGRSREAVKVLQKAAERGGTDNPWLHQNWAEALADLSQWNAAEVHLRKAEQQHAAAGKTPPRVMLALHQALAEVLGHQGKLDEAEAEYHKALALRVFETATRINYANFLLLRKGDPDAALAEARTVLAGSSARMAERIVAAAHYAKWATLRKKAPREAAEHLALAKQTSTEFSWIMPQAAKSIAASPAVESLVHGLLLLGISLETKDTHGDTGLTLAAAAGNARSVALLLKYGAEKEAADNEGLTALANAAYKGHVDLVKLLAAHGAKLDARDKLDLTPLKHAVSNQDVNMVRTLVALKADVNAATRGDGYTVLMTAAFYGNEEIAKLLVDAGADPAAVTFDKRQSAADVASARGYIKLADNLRIAEKDAQAKRVTK